jgi:PPM family protein phosphatase
MLGKMDCSGLTDVGRARDVNEDQYLIASLSKSMQVHHTSLQLDDQTQLFGPSQGELLLVADGRGGEAAGRRASSLAVDSLATYVLNTMPWFLRLREDSEEQFEDDLKAALAYCQQRVNAEGERMPGRRGMGTTLTMAYLCWPRLFVVHVGDSRGYLLRRGRLWQVTRDHTLARQLADEGGLQGPEGSRWSHVLWNVVGGGSDDLAPEAYRANLALGDTLLLCTDGLTRHVPDAEIARLLADDCPSRETCRRLIDAANAAGGTDNITAVVARFRDAHHQEKVAQAAAERQEAAGETAPGRAPAPARAAPAPAGEAVRARGPSA